MAMVTWVQQVNDSEIAALQKEPGSINRLDKPAAETFRTHYECSINYFVTGDAYPGDHPLASLLCGTTAIRTSTLENGAFGVSSAAEVAAMAEALAKVDVDGIRTAVAAADFAELMEEDVDDAEILAESDDPAKTLGDEVAELVRFYRSAAENALGVAAYTS